MQVFAPMDEVFALKRLVASTAAESLLVETVTERVETKIEALAEEPLETHFVRKLEQFSPVVHQVDDSSKLLKRSSSPRS